MEFIRKKKDYSKYNEHLLFAIDLELILTQKCNLACEHCMRGACSNKEISEEVLDATFSKFAYIDNLALGGGEIALVPHTIRKVTAALKKYNTTIHHCNFTSNGTVVNQETLDALKELQDYIVSCNDHPHLFTSPPEQKDVPMFVCFSFDDYHLKEMIRRKFTLEQLFDNIAKYQQVFGTEAIECRAECDMDIYDEGRAKYITKNVRKAPIQILTGAKYPFINLKDQALLMGNIICVSCDGEIIPTNISFANESVYSFGNIKTDSNATILANMNAYETNDNGYNKAREKLWKEMTAPIKVQKKYHTLLSYKTKMFMEMLEASVQKQQ